MKVMIPAKASSVRCINKNFRPFYKDQSLVDILIRKLKRAGFRKEQIYVASECGKSLIKVRQSHGINIIVRDIKHTKLECPTHIWLADIADKVSNWNEIAIALCTTPTFNDYRECIDKWKTRENRKYDSLSVTQLAETHLMMQNADAMVPLGWSFGSMHTTSQMLPKFYRMPFAFSILTRQAFDDCNYYFSRNCLWHKCRVSHLDINTTEEFIDAQAVYASRVQRNSQVTDQRNKEQLVRNVEVKKRKKSKTKL